ncbi:hypothetical protein GCM10023329_05990 [Streptomyces sanyensis]|uniref:Uncharacterized protein n=1 Tax=Streptomyces sanyensis TaxID=568869 RepID=A0ABP8ZRT7_9ACTN
MAGEPLTEPRRADGPAGPLPALRGADPAGEPRRARAAGPPLRPAGLPPGRAEADTGADLPRLGSPACGPGPAGTVPEHVPGPRRARGRSRQEAERRASEPLGRLGLADRAAMLPARRTGVRWRRVALARPPATDPTALLPDEPTPAPGRTDEVTDAARGRSRAGTTAVVAPREQGFARPAFRAAAGRAVGDRPPDARSDAAGNGWAEGLLSKTVKR